MPLELKEDETRCTLRLEGSLSIGSAQELKQLLLRGLAQPGELHVELGAMLQADLTTLQLLWAAQREARGAGKTCVMKGPIQERVGQMLADAGLVLAGVSL